MSHAHGRWVTGLMAVYGVVWLWLAIAPENRADWALENALVVVFALALWFARRHFVFSGLSYGLITLFLLLHAIGAHYTYAKVPYDAAWQALTGHTLNSVFGWDRNHYDRLVHFCYGLLLAYPIREVFLRVASVRGFWGYFLPLDLTLSTSALFELIEWGAAAVFGGELGAAYLGTQGDIWDAHKDMALAALGALLAMLAVAAVNAATRRDFAREWVDSLRPVQRLPGAGGPG